MKLSRKKLLYKSKIPGIDYSLNHAVGCSHGCRYPCYAYLIKKRAGVVESYNEWIKPRLVENLFPILNKELARIKHKIKKLHLSFSTDPFMYNQLEIQEASLKIIKLVNSFFIPCVILTKGVYPPELFIKKDFNKENLYGISLVSLDEKFRTKFEPGASPYKERIAALYKLHKAGFNTFVNMEPYPPPTLIKQDINLILKEISFVNEVMMGRLNYNPKKTFGFETEDYYREAEKKMKEFCLKNNIKFSVH